MKVYKVPKGTPLELDLDSEILITKHILRIVQEENYIIHTYNICKDHVHLVLECTEKQRDGIVRKLKGKSALLFGKGVNPLVQSRKQRYADNTQFHLWGQKYYWREILSNREYNNVINYTLYNREKHHLPKSVYLEMLIQSFTIINT
jgi:REP element-mobilizing transposase RayT